MRRKLLIPLGAALGVGFGMAGVWLLLLGFEVGEVYPPYSTLRADADGTEVLFEAVQRLGSIRVERNYLPLVQFQPAPKTTLILAGVSPGSWELMPKAEVTALSTMAKRGVRVILTLDSSTRLPAFSDLQKPEPNEKAEKRRFEKRPEKGAAEATLGVRVRLDRRRDAAKNETADEAPATAHPGQGTSLPHTIPWRANARLEPLDPAWRAMLKLDNGDAVALERRLGEGSIVVLADTYLLTNEAMWKNRQTAFLAWLMSGADVVLFDESHLGVADQPGLTSLVGRYRLHGALAAIFLVFALFVWRNSCPLVPVSARPLDSQEAGPAESGTSLSTLVRRSIPQGQLLAVAVQEWRKTARVDDDTLAQIEQIASQTVSQSAFKRDLVGAYGRVQDELSRKGFRLKKKE